MLSIVIAGCAKVPERVEYLKKNIGALRKHFPDAEYIVSFDKYGPKDLDLDVDHVHVHSNGLGHSFNWGNEHAKNDIILQLEDDWMCRMCWEKEEEPHKVVKIVEYGIKLVTENPTTILRLDNMNHDWYKPGCHSLGTEPITGRELFELHKVQDLKRWHDGFNPYFYDNHPQVKNKQYHKIVGRYAENVSVPQTEFHMCKQVLYYPTTKCHFFAGSCFAHIGDVQVREQQ